ncbi:MAG: metallophosphoesterase family protein [Planctomycetes bacterium]|nr:metallophosphoesterase family protein [Planctomycetota bacterium]
MYALISDLHSNIEALDAVMEDLSAFPVDQIYCLGDAIGYGPNPREVLKRIENCGLLLMGNHEEGLLYFAEDFNPRARAALDWTRDQLNDPQADKEENYAFWERLGDLPKSDRREGAIFVHGSLRNETKDYVMPGDIVDRQKMGEIWSAMDFPVCFFGHTHIPGVWTDSSKFSRPDEIDHEYRVKPAEKCIVNVGSVGQPRDGDNRACYVLVDDDRIQFRRVIYDFAKTMKKIIKIGELSDTLAARLKLGR